MVVASKASHLLAYCVASIAAHASVLTLMGHSRSERFVEARAPERELVEVSVWEPTPTPTETPEAPRPVLAAPRAPAPAPRHTHAYPVRADHDARPHDPALVHSPLPSLSSPEPISAPDAPVEAVATPRFTLALGAVSAPGAREPELGPGGARAGEAASAPLPEAEVSSKARLIGAVSPVYPADARAEEVEANVVLALVVSSQGSVEEARVVKGSGSSFGFDQAALASIRRARFVPARHQGRAVSVRMSWTVSFRLR